MSKVQTDNSHLAEKVRIRADSLRLINKPVIRVCEAFAGDGVIWRAVKKQFTGKQISVLRIDKKDDKKGVYLKGDNIKFLMSLDLTRFDIIDLDAYGSPAKQLDIVFNSGFSGIVHCTFIQSGFGMLDSSILSQNGFSSKMVDKCPTLFCKNGMQKMQNYLGNNGVTKIHGYFIDRKNYFWFNLDNSLNMNNLRPLSN